ncbi:MAG TPA: TraR/DksA C4-type zinc finger protein [Rhodocyclaceae bacterium]|jgi:RNA polymerase-binding transcription factor DksA|nr:TraR/DksA C4-type zinc finger protein [Rhodocyclaceae bacterium]
MASLSYRQFDQLRAELSRRESRLRNEIREEMLRAGDEYYSDIGGPVLDTGDAAQATLLADLDQALPDFLIRELREIEGAIRRMEDGTYGMCLQCGDDIEFPRLAACPTAVRCLDCQSFHEKTHAHPRTPSL